MSSDETDTALYAEASCSSLWSMQLPDDAAIYRATSVGFILGRGVI